MITKTDLQISNKSYTNLDFASIYPELLDLVKTLTNRWDPTVSNESDPGNVLLKLAAFIGDKTNYHIDKNTLEMFLPSATQNTSVRNIAQLNGYNPKYYLSATTDISFTFQGTVDQLPLSGDHYINFPKYTTTVKSEDGTIVYTLLDDCKLVQRNVTTVVPAIEGTCRGESYFRVRNKSEGTVACPAGRTFCRHRIGPRHSHGSQGRGHFLDGSGAGYHGDLSSSAKERP